MNLNNFTTYNYQIDMPVAQLRIRLAKSLALLFEAYQNDNYADIEVFLYKAEKYKADHKREQGWYGEHIDGTVEHYIAMLFSDAMAIYFSKPDLHYKYRQTKIIGRIPALLFQTELAMLCSMAAKEFDIISLDKDIDNAILALYDNKGSMITPALKLLGFLFVLSGKLEIQTDLFVYLYINYCGGINEKELSHTKAPLNGHSVKNTVKKRIETPPDVSKPDYGL